MSDREQDGEQHGEQQSTDEQPKDDSNAELLTAVAAGALAATLAVPAVPAVAQQGTPASAAADVTPTAGVAQAKRNQGPGASAMAKLCGDRTDGVCEVPKWSEDHLTIDSVLIGRVVKQQWPEIKMVGGWRPSDPYPDHPSGRAVDIMMPNGGTGKDKALGDEIALYFQEHAKEFGIEYMLWRQQTWSTGDKVGKWSSMADRGSPTANHVDHIHITVKGNKNSIAKQLVKDGIPGQAAKPTSKSNVVSTRAGTVEPEAHVPIDVEVTRTIVVESLPAQAQDDQTEPTPRKPPKA